MENKSGTAGPRDWGEGPRESQRAGAD